MSAEGALPAPDVREEQLTTFGSFPIELWRDPEGGQETCWTMLRASLTALADGRGMSLMPGAPELRAAYYMRYEPRAGAGVAEVSSVAEHADHVNLRYIAWASA